MMQIAIEKIRTKQKQSKQLEDKGSKREQNKEKTVFQARPGTAEYEAWTNQIEK